MAEKLPQQDNPNNLWLPDLEDWGKVNVEAYKVIFDLAKERFAELMSNSEDITTRSERLLIGISTVIAAFFGTSIKLHISPPTITVAILLYGLDLGVLLSLLLAKRAQTRGSRPSESFPSKLDDETKYKVNEQLKLVYHKQILYLEEKIKKMKGLNDTRSRRYQFGLVYTFALIVLSIVYVVFLIFHP